MEEIEFDDIKAGDYIKLIEKGDGVLDFTEYFKVEKITNNEIESGKSFYFEGDNFLTSFDGFGVFKKDYLSHWRITALFKLSEAEFYTAIGKYIITETWNN